VKVGASNLTLHIHPTNKKDGMGRFYFWFEKNIGL